MVRIEVKPPIALAAFPRISSSVSGFFFWGMILDGDAKSLDISTKENSLLDHIIRSSAILLRLTIIMATHDANSDMWSRVLVASNELSCM